MLSVGDNGNHKSADGCLASQLTTGARSTWMWRQSSSEIPRESGTEERNQNCEIRYYARCARWQHEWFHTVTYKWNSILSESKCFISLGLSWPIFFEGWMVLKFPKDSQHIFEWMIYYLTTLTKQNYQWPELNIWHFLLHAGKMSLRTHGPENYRYFLSVSTSQIIIPQNRFWYLLLQFSLRLILFQKNFRVYF